MDKTMGMDFTLFPTTEYVDVQQQNDVCTYEYISSDYLAQQPDFWPVQHPVYQSPLLHQHFSTSAQSSFAHHPISSNANGISQWQSRLSMASTNSSWPTLSNQPYHQRTSSLSSTINPVSPTISSYVSSPIEESILPVLLPAPKRRSTRRHMVLKKDLFATCVSRTRRSRRSQREPRYWCTSCKEPFIEKYDWKRHEETYQERKYVFRCELCSAIYFLSKDFLYHHDTRHNCGTCQEGSHVEAARQTRQSRTGWGCGFCTHFSTDWRERCNHVAHHFEMEGKTMSDWQHSDVILSLLQRPAILKEWSKTLQSQPYVRTDGGWNQHNTGRVDGYPENNAEPHLQDLLEYYRLGDDAAALAQLAFQNIAYPSSPSPVSKKDYMYHPNATLQNLMDDTESWDIFMSTIIEDDTLPKNVCDINFNMIDDTFDRNRQGFY